MSPSTFDVVRQRSSSQSTVSKIGILSTGSRTAAKIRGIVTKLPEGIPPAPTLATSVVSMINDLVGDAQLVAERLGHEEHGGRLVEGGAVVVEVGADAGGQLARPPRDPQPLERLQA